MTMRFLVDTSPEKMKSLCERDLVCGQLCTPLTGYKNWGGLFAIDNGAYSGLDRDKWFRCVEKHKEHIERCLFLAIPDVVGNARRTSELYGMFTMDDRIREYRNVWSFVMQDGMEDMHIIWSEVRHVFIGGSDRFKDSHAAYDIVKTAKALGVPVHVGRVNGIKRFEVYDSLGADTCDGSGIAMYDHMLEKIERRREKEPDPVLFD